MWNKNFGVAVFHQKSKRGTTFSDMDAGRWHFLGSQRVELKARPFFLLALRACRPREVGFYQSSFFGHQGAPFWS